MNIALREYKSEDVLEAIAIWNTVVMDGIAFPQEDILTAQTGESFFKSQTYTGIAYNSDNGEIVGIYILHPNNVGRCGHICNASYAVKKELRGNHIGEALVRDCMKIAYEKEFRILQFNAVVKTNASALHLYEKLGFTQLGVIPNGFRFDNDKYEDIIPHYITLG